MHVSEALMITGGALIGWILSRREDRQARRPSQDYLAGVNFLVKDQPDRAVEAFLRAVKNERDMVETQFALGALFRRRGELERAIRVHSDLLKREALEPSFREQAAYALAQDYQRAGLMDRAEELLESLVQSKIYRLVVLSDLINLYEMEREWQKAIDVHQTLAQESTVDQPMAIAHYYCELADAALTEQRLDASKAALKSAFKINKAFARARLLHVRLELHDVANATGAEAKAAVQSQLTTLTELMKSESRLMNELLPLYQSASERLADATQMEHAWQRLATEVSAHPAVADALAQAVLMQERFDSPALQQLVADYVRRDPWVGGLLTAFGVAPQPVQLETLKAVGKLMKRQALSKARYRCGECGFTSRLFFWQCPGCRHWDAWESLTPMEGG